MARRSITQTLRQPALLVPPILFPLCLLAVNVGGLDAATKLPGLPDRRLPQLRDRDPVHAGRAVRGHQRRARAWRATSRPGFLKRLALTPMQRAALLLGNLAGVMTVAALSSLIYLAVGFAAGLHVEAGVGGVLVLIVLAFLVALGFAALGAFVGLRAGSGEAVQGCLPGLLRLPLPVLAGAAAAADRAGLVPHDRDLEPGLLHARGHPLGGHHGLGRGGAGARLRASRSCSAWSAIFGASRGAADAAGADMRRFVAVARGVAWRQIHNFTHNPAFLLPSIIFPLFFFTAFAGGLSSVSNAPGFDFPTGYTAFQFVFVLLQSAAFGGVFTGFAVAADFERGFARRLMLAAPNRLGDPGRLPARRAGARADRRRAAVRRGADRRDADRRRRRSTCSG